MKVFVATFLFTLVALISCEPPAPRSQYLPPGQSPLAQQEHKETGHQQTPSAAYGAPAETSAVFPSPQTQYGAPSGHGPATGNHQQAPSSAYGVPTETLAVSPSPQTQYGAPSGHGSASSNRQQAPSSAYGAPAETTSAFNRQQAPSSAYGAPAETTSAFNRPQSEYGAPAAGNDGYAFNGGRQEENYGPAKYEFQYDVQDYPSGQDFGHKETRDGDKTVGRYYVLLPDGRKQIVQYEADEQGYRPVITYEDTGAGKSGQEGQGGYDNNAQESGKFNGY